MPPETQIFTVKVVKVASLRFRHAGTPRYIIHVIRDRYGVLL